MATGRDGLDPAAIRDRLEAFDPGSTWETVRERLDAFYVRYFMPPSVTRDDGTEAQTEPGAVTDVDASYEGFDFGAWLQAGRESGPRAPPSEPRVVTEAAGTETGPVASADEYEGFAFAEWLADGEAYDPLGADAGVEGPTPDAERATATRESEFAFDEWLAEGETYDPVDVGGGRERAGEGPLGEPSGVKEPTAPGTPGASAGLHPAKAATFALFLAVVALVALTVAGHLPALGPTGFAG